MSGVVFQFQERARGNVTSPMLAWAVAMAAVLFLYESHLAARDGVVWAGIAVTALFGLYLGARRRSAAIFVAPIVSWLFAWLPLWIAAMIHDGFVSGLFRGLFLITFGWILIGFVEFVWLAVAAFLARLVRRPGPRSDPDVVIFGPDDH
jgi:hypothetical protein